MKKSWIIMVWFVFLIGAGFLLSCTSFTRIVTIQRYLEFIASRSQHTVLEQYQAPEIEGFVPLAHVPFDFAKPFAGEYTQVVFDGEELLLSKEGKLYYAPQEVFDANLLFDRYVFQENYLCGVKTIFDEILVAPLYDEVVLSNTWILARNSIGTTDIYYNKALFAVNVTGTVEIYDSGLLLINGKLCGTDLQPVTAFGYEVFSGFVNGARIVSDNTLFGYDCGNSVIEPQFIEAGQFNEYGYAYAVDVSGAYHIIDKMGKIILTESDGQRPLGFDGVNLVLWNGQSFGLAGQNVIFSDLMSFSPIDGYLIDKTDDNFYCFFSTVEDEWLPECYRSVVVYEEHFLLQLMSDRYVFLDKNMTKIVDGADYISFDGSTLLVEKDETYQFYRKESVV